MLLSITRLFFGKDFTSDDLKRFGILSLTLLFIIGTYWLMRPLKDALFMNIVGAKYVPLAKTFSLFFVIGLVFFYQKLVDLVAKYKLFYIICTAYAALFAGVAYFLSHPTIGLANTDTDPSRILGWVIYLSIESFGSIVVALFWSYVATTTDTSTAKRGYPLIIAGAQFGSIAGPYLAQNAPTIGLSLLMLITSVGIMCVPVMIAIFVRMFPSATGESTSGKDKKPTSMLEGIRLLLSKPYLLGILGIATLYEVIGTILDYQLKVAAQAEFGNAAAVASFLGKFGIYTNGVSLVLAFVGTSFFIRRFGLTFCLLAFPATVAAVIAGVYVMPSLWAFFYAMIAVKALSYALNNPCKEIMYIPTSKDVKFKAKSWIDSFGGRSAKGLGSQINMLIPMELLASLGSLVCFGVIGLWVFVAYYVGTTNDKLVRENKIIE